MTSVKYYSNWMREAGRGHIAAWISWGCHLLFTLSFVMTNATGEDTFFGLGSNTRWMLCMGLGIFLAYVEFCYLLQSKKLDFYYSLPVRPGTVFWTRYLHGVVTFLLPMLVSQFFCGIYQVIKEPKFGMYAWGYTLRSILAAMLVFLIGYHLALLALAACGRVVSALLFTVGLAFYTEALLVLLHIFSAHIFETFYRIPFLEKCRTLLVPLRLAAELSGQFLYDEREVWTYVPAKEVVLAGIFWMVLFLVSGAFLMKKRRTEMTGKAFVLPVVERMTEILLSILAGLGVGALVVLNTAGERTVVPVCVVGICLVVCSHLLLEGALVKNRRKILRRKGQLLIEMTAFIVLAGSFFLGKSSFDHYIPEKSEVAQASVCMNGLDMDQSIYIEVKDGKRNDRIQERLQTLTLEQEGKDAVIDWATNLLANERGDLLGNQPAGQMTTAVIRYQLKNGQEKYRSYPVKEATLNTFASIYETGEYKEKQYPLTQVEELEKEKVSWSDGITSVTLKLSGEEKSQLLSCYRKDVEAMKMEQLKEALPAGILIVESDVSALNLQAFVYPSFEETMAFLQSHAIDSARTLSDYTVASVKVEETQTMQSQMSGGIRMHFYDREEELREWAGQLVPEELAIQPVLYPVDGNVRAEAEVEDPNTGSANVIDCYGLK